MSAKRIEPQETPKVDAIELDIIPEAPQVVQSPTPPKEVPPVKEVAVVPPSELKVRVPNIKCPTCAWIGGDYEMKNRSYLNDKSPYFKTANPEDLFCPSCGDILIELVKSKEDPSYPYYGYDFENRKVRIIAREVRIRALDPDAYDATRRRELAKHGISIPRN